MSWLTGMLAGTLCVEGNLSSARTLKAPLKGSPRYPPSFIPNKSSENKHTALLPIKARQQWRGGRQARPGHRSKTSGNKIKPKKQRELTVFLAANQNLMLRRVAHERESGRGKHDTSTYAGGCREGIEPDFHYSSKSLDEGLNTTFWQNTPPPSNPTRFTHTLTVKKSTRGCACTCWGESRSQLSLGLSWGQPGKATFRLPCGCKQKHLWAGLPCLSVPVLPTAVCWVT